MAVGARDATDKKLVRMYANTKTMAEDNTSKVDPEQILRSMTMMAMQNRYQINMQKPMVLNNQQPVQKRKSDIA
ncbi:MAG: hypothetical protein WCK67_09115 [bacterium]